MIEAWHISPYKFSKFSYEFIGTTEHTPHGWGFYLSENKTHAEDMRNRTCLIGRETFLYRAELDINQSNTYLLDKCLQEQTKEVKQKIEKYSNDIEFFFDFKFFIHKFFKRKNREILKNKRKSISNEFKENRFSPELIEIYFPKFYFIEILSDIGIKAFSLHEQDSPRHGRTYILFDNELAKLDLIKTFPV